MEVTVIEQNTGFEIRHYEFKDVYGRPITEFFQLVRRPHHIIGGYNSLGLAQAIMNAAMRSGSLYTYH